MSWISKGIIPPKPVAVDVRNWIQSLSVDIAAQVDEPNPKCKIAGDALKKASSPNLNMVSAFIEVEEYIPLLALILFVEKILPDTDSFAGTSEVFAT